MAAWGGATTQRQVSSFASILEDQRSGKETEEVEVEVMRAIEALEGIPAATKEEDEDTRLARALQEIEDNEVRALYSQARQEPMSKIKTLVQHEKLSSQSSGKASCVGSMMWQEAEARERQLALVGGTAQGGLAVLNSGEIISKHDPLLSSLNNAAKISALPGVGDLEREKLLISNEVANNVRSYTKKLERQNKDK